MKISIALCALAAGFSACFSVAMPVARAQINGAPQFGDPAELQPLRKELEQANSKVTACHVIWKRVLRINPVSAEDADPQKRAADEPKAARARGETEEQAQKSAAIERREALRSQKGREINFLLDYTRVGQDVLCVIEQYPSPKQQVKTVEFFDGTNFLRADIENNHKNLSYKRGEVTRDSEDIVSYSVGGDNVMRLLLGIPLDQDFNRRNLALTASNSVLKQARAGQISLVQEAHIEDKQWINPQVFNFDQGNYSLQSIEKYGLALIVDGKSMIIKRAGIDTLVTASDYKRYVDGIWYPSKVTVKEGNWSNEYTLVEAKFNRDVSANGVLLPGDVLITDGRFGFGFDAVDYYADDGKLLTDEQVKKRQNPQAKEEAEK